MRVVIIGGGIAGLFQAIVLRNIGYEVIVCEQSDHFKSKGFAFLIKDEALQLLNKNLNNSIHELQKVKIDSYNLNGIMGEELINSKVDNWYCVRRKDIIAYLFSHLKEGELLFNRKFSHFITVKDKVKSAVFANGSKETGDIFIGADGSNSIVRKQLFGNVSFSKEEVNEIVGISDYRASGESNSFRKFQSITKGLSMGYIPVSETSSVWFIQYDIQLENNIELNTAELIESFCRNLLVDFPQEVQNVLDNNNFENTYIWRTRDFIPLEKMHRENVVLIGDAAHLALPFTSSGTTNSIEDAVTLAEFMQSDMKIDEIFNRYYQKRKDIVRYQFYKGREIKKIFLNPLFYGTEEIESTIPLVYNEETTTKEKKKPYRIIYFTDPVCSSCWINQCVIRKFKVQYGDHIELQYRMGGLLPSWDSFSNKGISSPKDAALLWNDLEEKYKIPFSGNIWLEDPLESSFPASISFKAAQLQSKIKAEKLLRRLMELLFLEKKNISKPRVIIDAVIECGLNPVKLESDTRKMGKEIMSVQLKMKNKFKVKTIPSMFFISNDEITSVLEGVITFEQIEKEIQKLGGNIQRNDMPTDPFVLFQKFDRLLLNEFVYLMNIPNDKGQLMLQELKSKGLIEEEIKVGVSYWKRKIE